MSGIFKVYCDNYTDPRHKKRLINRDGKINTGRLKEAFAELVASELFTERCNLVAFSAGYYQRFQRNTAPLETLKRADLDYRGKGVEVLDTDNNVVKATCPICERDYVLRLKDPKIRHALAKIANDNPKEYTRLSTPKYRVAISDLMKAQSDEC